MQHEDDTNLFEKFSRIVDLLHRYRHRNHRLHGPMGDPHRGQGRVLALLKMRPEISQKELAYLLDIRQQSLGELLAKLERNGYIERSTSENDRRVLQIRLTEEGAKASEQRHDFDTLFKSLNRDEQETLSGYLDRVITDLETELADCPDGEPEHPPHRHRHGHPHHPPHDHDGEGPDEDDHPPHGPRHHHGHPGMRRGMGPHGPAHDREDQGCGRERSAHGPRDLDGRHPEWEGEPRHHSHAHAEDFPRDD